MNNKIIKGQDGINTEPLIRLGKKMITSLDDLYHKSGLQKIVSPIKEAIGLSVHLANLKEKTNHLPGFEEAYNDYLSNYNSYKNYRNSDVPEEERFGPPSQYPSLPIWSRVFADNDYFLHLKNSMDREYWKSKNPDNSSVIKITAPNTDTSKFVFNQKITEDALKEIERVSKQRNQDPYDVLSHVLIEGHSDFPSTTVDYYNTHDVVQRQLNPRLFGNQNDTIHSLKQMGIWSPNKKFSPKVIKKYANKMNEKRINALNNVIIPESTIDAVALRMLLHGRDFNPAQKGYKFWDGTVVKHSYTDMMDSAIKSLKTHMPNLFKDYE